METMIYNAVICVESYVHVWYRRYDRWWKRVVTTMLVQQQAIFIVSWKDKI